MADDRKISGLMEDDDIAYLSVVYELDENQVRGMTDAEWCGFLGCVGEELAYYLFDDDRAEGDDIESLDDNARVWVADEAEFSDVEQEQLFDIHREVEKVLADSRRLLAETQPVIADRITKGPSALDRYRSTHHYTKPSYRKEPETVDHHFELVN